MRFFFLGTTATSLVRIRSTQRAQTHVQHMQHVFETAIWGLSRVFVSRDPHLWPLYNPGLGISHIEHSPSDNPGYYPALSDTFMESPPLATKEFGKNSEELRCAIVRGRDRENSESSFYGYIRISAGKKRKPPERAEGPGAPTSGRQIYSTSLHRFQIILP